MRGPRFYWSAAIIKLPCTGIASANVGHHPVGVRMQFGIRSSAVLFAAAALTTLTTLAAQPAREAASAYPSKPVRLLMGPAAGGPTDAIGRVLATRLNEMWKQPVIIENRSGAGNTIATAAAARATP